MLPGSTYRIAEIPNFTVTLAACAGVAGHERDRDKNPDSSAHLFLPDADRPDLRTQCARENAKITGVRSERAARAFWRSASAHLLDGPREWSPEVRPVWPLLRSVTREPIGREAGNLTGLARYESRVHTVAGQRRLLTDFVPDSR